MKRIWNGLKLSFLISLVVGLLFSAGFFSMLLYAEVSGKELPILLAKSETASSEKGSLADGEDAAQPPDAALAASALPDEDVAATPAPPPEQAFLDAPAIRQYPELPAGCEVTSLAMLLQYYGVDKDKMELMSEFPKDPTPIRWKGETIQYWGNPNTGYVGDMTRKGIGFGVYHSGMIDFLKTYIPTGIDLTDGDFSQLEQQIAQQIPVIVWTTNNFNIPQKWVEWDTPIGPIRTTFSEHAVLLVGYDADYVYVNDPLSGKKNVKIGKERFVKTWEVMGKQALSYTKE